MKKFRGNVAVITGGAGGIGFAMARRFAAEGMKIVLADIDERALASAAREIGADTLAVRTDVSAAGDVEALAARTLEAFGAVHIVCNNAGVGGCFAACWEQSLPTWEQVLGVNVYGVIHGLRTFLPILLRQNTEGHVVNTASMAGLLSLPYGSPYHVSKHAVVALTESLHHELALRNAKIQASVLCPAFVKTRISDSTSSSRALETWEQGFRRFVESGIPPEQVAERVFEAIRDERFWILTHPEQKAAIHRRMEGLVEERNPALDMPSTMRHLLGLP